MPQGLFAKILTAHISFLVHIRIIIYLAYNILSINIYSIQYTV